MKIFALYSIKGGVGKTAAAVNLAYLAAQEGPTLLIDLDPQGASSFYFRVRPGKKLNARRLVKGGKGIAKNIKGTDYEGLDILPASLSYRNLDLKLDEYRGPRKILRDVLQPLASEYAYLFLDCPPGLSLVAENVFVAADHLLVPVVPTTLSANTYDLLCRHLKLRKLNRQKLLPFFSMVEKKKKLHRDILASLNQGEERFLVSQIPYKAEVEKMGLQREPLCHVRPGGPAALCYGSLWAEIKERVAD